MSVPIRLFGSPRIERDGEVVELRPSRPLLLLCYLAHAGDWVAREHLAFLFWPDSPDGKARVNLRQLLRRAKSVAFAAGLEIEPERVRWSVATDVAAFRRAVADGRWDTACRLYHGPLLAGFGGAGGDAVEAWLDLARTELARSWHRAALAWSADLERTGRHAEAADLLGDLLADDELVEDVMKRYLRNAYLAGRRDEALRRYDDFARRLRRDLALEPLAGTKALAASIRAARPLAEETHPTARRELPPQLRRPPRLIGREDDIALLRSSHAAMRLVSGDAGSGKSRLLAELAPDALVLHAQEGMQGLPYYPLTVAIRRCLASAEPLPDLGSRRADLARLVPEIAPEIHREPTEAEKAEIRLRDALVRFFEAIGGTLRFDDLQWCDDATLEVLTRLVTRGGIRVLGAYRPRETGRTLRAALDDLRRSELLYEHQLAPLGPADIEQLMAVLTDSERGPPLFSRWLWRTAGGNPMFTLETLKSLFEAGALWSDEHGWSSVIDDITRDYGELRVPRAVTEVIERRVAHLSEQTGRVLKSAAVAGPELDETLLARVSGLSGDAVLAALAETEEAGLTRDRNFAHDLVRQSVYAALGSGQRRALHTRVAEHLGADTDPSIRAEHWLAAQRLAPAVEAWLEAVEDLERRGLFDAAVTMLERGVERSDESALRQRLEARLVEILQRAGRSAETLARSEALLAECELPELRVAAHNARALVQLREGRVEAAAESVAQLDRELERAGMDDTVDITMTRAILHHARHEHAAAIALLEPLAALLRREDADTDLGTVLTSLAAAYDSEGKHLRALPLHREALALAKSQGHRLFQVDAALNLLYCLMALERAEEGLAEGEAALELGHFENSPTLRANLAAAYLELGRYRDARRHYREVIANGEHDLLLAIAWARLAETEHRLGDDDAAVEAIDQAIAAAEQSDYQLARARVVITAVQLGTAEQAARVRVWLDAIDPEGLPDYMRSEISALD